jgi:hypothetical protein
MKKFLFTIAVVLLPVLLWAKDPPETVQPVTASNGNPGLRFSGVATLGRIGFVIVERTGAASDPVFLFHVTQQSGLHFCSGILHVSARRVTWKADCHTDPFDVPRSEVQIKESKNAIYGSFIHVDASGRHYLFAGTADDKDQRVWSDSLNRFMETAIQDISASDKEFWKLRGERPPVAQPIDDAFRAQAVAWRSLAVKPELPEEARKQRLLAESYLREKDFKGSIEHYEAGVRAWPVWPEGWFNLAALYAETGDYAYAVDRMKHYLELMPDSPDADAARDSIVIWEDKAKRQ